MAPPGPVKFPHSHACLHRLVWFPIPNYPLLRKVVSSRPRSKEPGHQKPGHPRHSAPAQKRKAGRTGRYICRSQTRKKVTTCPQPRIVVHYSQVPGSGLFARAAIIVSCAQDPDFRFFFLFACPPVPCTVAPHWQFLASQYLVALGHYLVLPQSSVPLFLAFLAWQNFSRRFSSFAAPTSRCLNFSPPSTSLSRADSSLPAY